MRHRCTLAACALALAGCGGGGSRGGDAGTLDAGSPATWLGVVGTGQSLSVGAASGNLVFTTPSGNNLKLSLGALAMTWPIDANNPELGLAPAGEPSRAINESGDGQRDPLTTYAR